MTIEINIEFEHLLSDDVTLKVLLESLSILKQDYLYQTHIPLLKVNDRPYDVRVVMQKYQTNKWACTGIECRVAGENEDLTNIARGRKSNDVGGCNSRIRQESILF